MTLVLQLLVFNDARYLRGLLATLAAQTDQDWPLFLRDQSSEPSERARVTEALAASGLPSERIVHTVGENLGFAGGHQHLFTEHDADLVMLVNVDTLLEPEYVQTLRSVMERDAACGAASGVLRRWHEDGQGGAVRTPVMDTLGLVRRCNESVSDIGAGQTDVPVPQTLFGVSGCLPMYRRTAVTTPDDPELFDPSYVSYKEDVDVAYRLRGRGWTAVTVQEAVAYHDRTFAPGARRRMSDRARFYSYRNHLWNLLTHLTARDWLCRGWCILPYEAAKAVAIGLWSPRGLWRAWRETVLQWPRLSARRRSLQKSYDQTNI